MGGSLRQTYEGWREELKICLAHTEAVIDFGDVRICLPSGSCPLCILSFTPPPFFRS